MKSTLLALLLALPLAFSPAHAAAPSVTVEMDAQTYSVVGTLTDAAPVATITVLDADGNPAAGVGVRVAFIRQVQFVGFVGNETFTGETDAEGVFTVGAGQLSSLPGSYLVTAFALGTTGSDRYSVGA